MRLVCPNCDAQYEVDDAAIPRAGRDVQCSSCGHAWFQRHPDVLAEEEFEEEVFLSEDEAALAAPPSAPPPPPPAPPPPQPVASPPPAPAREAAPAPMPPRPPLEEYEDEDEMPAPVVAQPPRKPALDDALMAVLREEAEREAAVRAQEAPKAAAAQAEKAAPPPVPPSVLAARERFAELSVDRDEAIDVEEEEIVTRPASRRELLPDIEEINSTLRASTEPRGEPEDELPPPEMLAAEGRGGFRSGFLLMLLIAAGLWLTYVMAPRIVAQIPASGPAMEAYVAAVDKARVGVDAALQSASRSLRDLSGQGG